MLTFLIMAGGSGERFWPLSTKEKPKQLLNIFSNKSLIRLTVDRILPLVEKKQIFIATNEIQIDAVKKELPELLNDNFIIEPAFRDTASAIAYGSMIISKYYDNPTIVVLASDHLIADENNFRNIISKASESIEDKILTIGLKPLYPETGYGYIEADNLELEQITKVISFKEKPDILTANEYLKNGNFLWNSGMFIFKYKTLMDSFAKYSKPHYDINLKLNQIIKSNEGVTTSRKAKELFLQYPKISIDFAIMEKADNIYVIPANFGWNDVGSFIAFEDLFEADKEKNIIKNTKAIIVDSYNNIIVSDDYHQRVSLLGIKNKVVIVTKDNILICEKDKVQEIKKIIKKLEQGDYNG